MRLSHMLAFAATTALAATAFANPPAESTLTGAPQAIHATEAWNLRTGQPMPQGPTTRTPAVTYDSLTRTGARGNLNLSYVDPNCYTNPACTTGNAYIAVCNSNPAGAWVAPLSPNTNLPTYIWGDDYSNDTTLWGSADPNSTRELTQHVICPAVNNTGVTDPNLVPRTLNVLFYDANVGTANPAAFVDGYAVTVPGTAGGANGWILTVTVGGIFPPKDGTIVYLYTQRTGAGVPVNANAGAYFIGGGDLDPNLVAGMNYPGPLTAVGTNDMVDFWFGVDPSDNITPPAPPNPPATIADVTDILNRNALWAWGYVVGAAAPYTKEIALYFPHQMTTDSACACVGFLATGVCATDQDALDVVLFNFGTTGWPPNTNGDLDGDGDVDQDDLDIVLFDFGCSG